MRLEQAERQAKMLGNPGKFEGVPKDFNEIVRVSSQLDMMPIQSKDRLLALKELCLYANAGPRSI